MSGPQFELPVSVSEEKIDKEKVVKVGRLCYICEERYPVLFEGIMKEFKANIMDPLLSHSQSSYSAVVTSCISIYAFTLFKILYLFIVI